jgi:preprotein translocase subunit SecA
MSDVVLAVQTESLRARLAGGASADDLLPEAFAAVRAAAQQALGVTIDDAHYAAGEAMYAGKVVELAGADQALAVSLPAYLGAGVHLMTLDKFLAQRRAATSAARRTHC